MMLVINVKFYTYASRVISMLDYTKENSSVIIIPAMSFPKLITIKKLIDNFVSESGKFPSYDEICDLTGFNKEMVVSFMCIKDGILDIDSVEEEQLAIESGFDEDILLENTKEKFLSFLKENLSNEELQLILMRFGYNNNNGKSLEEMTRFFWLYTSVITDRFKSVTF